MNVDILPSSSEYFVLKDGRMIGPLNLEDLELGLRENRFALSDFVQSGDLPLWQPLTNIVDLQTAELAGAVVPDWKSIFTLVWLRLRYQVSEQTVVSGVVGLLASLAFWGLSRWPAIFWAPWLVVSVAAGVVLIRRRRELPGTALLLGALLFSIVGYYDDWQSKGQELVQTAVSSVGPIVESVKLAPSAPVETPMSEAAPAAVEAPSVVEAKAEPLSVAAGSEMAGAIRPPSLVPETPATVESTVPKPTTLPTANEAKTDTDLIQSHTDAFVIVKGMEGSGSGFICRDGDKTYLYTNIHVVAGMTKPTFTLLNNAPITPGAADAAGGPDIVRFAMGYSPQHPLELMKDVDANVRIGDEVVVHGNSGGGGVVTSLKGEVRGLGPDRLEVSAEFIPGNSGSPIVHVKSGKVIGIATYLTRRRDEFGAKSAGSSAPTVVVRRFGYRIDKVPRWEPILWPTFQWEAGQVHRVEELTGDLIGFLEALRTKKAPNFATETLRRPAVEWISSVSTKKLSESDRLNATQRFLGSLRAMSRGDIAATEARFRYTYFKNELRDEMQVREQLYQAFNTESNSLTSTAGRSGYR